MGFMSRKSDEVLLELIKLNRDVLRKLDEATGSNDRVSRRVDTLRSDIAEIAKTISESAVNSAAIARAQEQIDTLSQKLIPVVADSQSVEDKLTEAGKE